MLDLITKLRKYLLAYSNCTKAVPHRPNLRLDPSIHLQPTESPRKILNNWSLNPSKSICSTLIAVPTLADVIRNFKPGACMGCSNQADSFDDKTSSIKYFFGVLLSTGRGAHTVQTPPSSAESITAVT